MKLKTIFIFLIFIIVLNVINGEEIKEYVNGLNFQLELYSNEYRYYNFCNAYYDYYKPLGYVKVHSEHEIRDVLLYAKSIGKTLSVRSGGHSTVSFSILNDTINLDMSGMKGISINVEEMTVTVQSGVLMGELYEELEKYGLISTGGTGTGIGMGIALGGGSGFIGPKHGYMIDNIIEHTIVLANGHIVKANKHNEYSDLHWALLGSGNGGFGVVADIKVKLHHNQPFYYHNQITVQHKDIVDSILILNEFVESLSEDEQSSMHFYIGDFYISDLNILRINYFYIDREISKGFTYFNKLLKLIQKSIPDAYQTLNVKTEKTFKELLNLSPDDSKDPAFIFGIGRFSLLNNQTAKTIFSITNKMQKTILDVKNDEKSFCNTQVNYNGGQQIYGDPIELKQRTSFRHRGYENKWYIGMYCIHYNSDNHKQFKELKSYIQEIVDSLSPRIYANIPEDETDNWQTKVYGDNYPKLQEIKLKYDPSNYFNYPQSIELPKTNIKTLRNC